MLHSELLSTDWRDDGGSPRHPVAVHRLVELRAAAEPARPAITADGRQLSYGELNREANRLAWALRARGAEVETTLALLMERSIDMLVAFLAVMKTGAAALLLDPAHPLDRLRTTCAELEVPIVLSLTKLWPAGRLGVDMFYVDTELPALAGQPDHDLSVPLHPDNLAYVIQTSGSTGKPKRVAVTHRSVAHSVATHREGHRISSSDRASWLAPPGASVSVGELWPYLAAGASVHAAPTGVGADAETLRDWLLAERITKAFVSMPIAEHLFLLPWPEDTALRLLTVGSDRVRRWASATLPFEVAVSCGSSEANGITSCLTPWDNRVTSVTADDELRAGVPPVGRPWPDVRLHLLDSAMQPVAPGEVGELYVGGPELARGYVGDAGQTADRFVPDPFAGGGERLYRTGDLARWGAGGLLHHHGRVDREVRIRGFRADPAETERALLAQPGVRDAVVTAARHPDGETALVAYVVQAGGGDLRELGEQLRAVLPAHLVPAVTMPLDALPVNANGKVDHIALPTPDWSLLRASYAPPADELEGALLAMYAEVLGIPGLGVYDHFFEMGGNSLSGTRLVARITRRLRIRVRLGDLLANPTVVGLARLLRERDAAPSAGRGA